MPALYLALDPAPAIKEAAQGFAHKFDTLVLCTYEIDCEDVVDLRTEAGPRSAGITTEDMACAWFAEAAEGREPPGRLPKNQRLGNRRRCRN
jgi:RES domain-containing protein